MSSAQTTTAPANRAAQVARAVERGLVWSARRCSHAEWGATRLERYARRVWARLDVRGLDYETVDAAALAGAQAAFDAAWKTRKRDRAAAMLVAAFDDLGTIVEELMLAVGLEE